MFVVSVSVCVCAALCLAEISASVASGMRIHHNSDSLHMLYTEGCQDGQCTNDDLKTKKKMCPRLLSQEDGLCCRECFYPVISQIQMMKIQGCSNHS